jgi:hypothetical protein
MIASHASTITGIFEVVVVQKSLEARRTFWS